MEKEILYTYVLTADDEEPRCDRCDFVTSASDKFCEECAYFWSHYRRTVIEYDEKKEDLENENS